MDSTETIEETHCYDGTPNIPFVTITRTTTKKCPDTGKLYKTTYQAKVECQYDEYRGKLMIPDAIETARAIVKLQSERK